MFTATEGGRSNELGVTYLSCYPEHYYSVSICPVHCNYAIGNNFCAFNEIDNHNRMRKYDVALEKYWATQSIYFRLSTTVSLGMGIIAGKLLLCHDISEQSKEKNISMI